MATRRTAIAGWTVMLILLIGLTCRVLWLASYSETGIQTLKQQWKDATLGLVFGKRTPIQSREPIEQAEFWLSEVDRRIDAPPTRAEIAMCAALILDSPSPGFVALYVKHVGTFPGVGLMPLVDDDGINQATDAFEQKCKQRCLELAATATQLEPKNPEWWQLRALLLWRCSIHSYDESPRDSNWREVLEECARHDPNNALYDYLAAYFYWESSAEQEISEHDDRLVIKNNKEFNRGIDSFNRGQSKPVFAIGDAGFSAVAKYLADSEVPLSEQPSIVNSRSIHLRRSILVRNIVRWQALRAEEEIAAGNIKPALAMHRQNLHLLEQFTSSSASTTYDNVALVCRIVTAAQMASLAKEHKVDFSANEIQEIEKLGQESKLDEAVVGHAAIALSSGKPQRTAGVSIDSSPSMVALAVTVSMLSSLVIVLLVFGCISILLTFLLNGTHRIEIGWAGQSFGVVAALAVTMTLFGLAPARIVDQAVQEWAFTILVILTPVVLLSWFVWGWLQRRNFKYSLRALLASVVVICVLLGVVSVTRPIVTSFTTFPFRLAMPARGWEGWDAGSLESVLRPLGRWIWALLQWTAYYGQYLTVALWAGVVAVLLRIKTKIEQRKVDSSPPTFQDRLDDLFRSLGVPAITLAALALIAYLALLPNTLDAVEQNFQAEIAFARRPDGHWSKVEDAVQKVRADIDLMNELRQAVEDESRAPQEGEK